MAREFNKIAILGRREDTRVAGPLAQLVEHLTQAGLEVGDDTQLEGADLALEVSAPRSRPLLDLLGLEEVRDGLLVSVGDIDTRLASKP